MSILKVERKLLKMLSQPHCSSRRLSLFWVALLLKGQKELFPALKVVEKNLWTLSGVDENAKDLPILYEKGFLKGKILQRLRIVERKHYCTTEVVTSVKSRAKFNLIERRFQVTYFCGNLSSRERSELKADRNFYDNSQVFFKIFQSSCKRPTLWQLCFENKKMRISFP